jgi:MFS family permease
MSLAVATAAGSAGQVVGPPVIEWLLGTYPFQTVFLILGLAVLSVLLFLPLLAAPPKASKAELEESLGTVSTAPSAIRPTR